MERPTETRAAGAASLLEATTSRGFKCAKCGNMVASDQDEAVCDVCGFRCTLETCAIVYASNEDF